MTALLEYDVCNPKEVALKDITEASAIVYNKLLKSNILDSVEEEIRVLKSLFENDYDVIALAILSRFHCDDSKRQRNIIDKVASTINKIQDENNLEKTRNLLYDYLGFDIDIKSDKEGYLLIEAIDQYYESIHKKMLLARYDNSNKMESTYKEAKLTLEISLRRSGRFELADQIAKEEYIKPYTIKSFSLQWKEYWVHRINKLAGADKKRTEKLMNKVEKRVNSIVTQNTTFTKDEKEKQKNKSKLDHLLLCQQQNISYLDIYKYI